LEYNQNKDQELNTQLDYDNLFEAYKKGNLKKTKSTQTVIWNLLKKHTPNCFNTCFEANIVNVIVSI
jgi:uncharacterized protein (DUF488 family)